MTLTFDTSFEPSTGQLVTIAPQVARLTAPNRGPYTFTGTNTYLLGATDLLVVDPGPTDERHFEALITAIDNRPLRAILLTHTHKDHSALARLLSAKTGAPLWFGGPHRLSRPRRLFEINPLAGACDWSLKPDRTLIDGEELAIGGQKIRVLATPGHCANHLAFVLPESASILTGDHVMGWSSTLVAVPDGSMADYLTSLDRLARLPEKTYLPGHGGPIAAGPQFAAGLKAHRLSRDAQILEILAKDSATRSELLDKIYPNLGPALRFAASMTLSAHLERLADAGMLVRSRTWPAPARYRLSGNRIAGAGSAGSGASG